MSANFFAGSVCRNASGPSATQALLRVAELGEPKPSEHAEATISVPPGSRMSSGVTMPFTVW